MRGSDLRDRSCERVGDIVGSNVEGIEEGEDCTEGENVIVLVKRHLGRGVERRRRKGELVETGKEAESFDG
jgi:hypothetical protein